MVDTPIPDSHRVRRPLWKRVEIISLPVVVVILFATAVSALTNWNTYVKYRDHVVATRDLVESTRALVNSIVDAETAQRGYLLTGDPRFRKPYDRAVRVIPGQVTHLRDLTVRDAAESAQVVKLSSLTLTMLRELRETIAMRDSKGFQAALGMMQTGSAEQTMDQIRATSSALVTSESKQLTELVTLTRARSARTWFISAVGDLVLGLMLVAASIAIFRATARREELILQLRKLSAQSESAEERSRNILESIGDGFISFDRNWNITYLNAEAERLLGRSKTELLGRNYWTEFPETAGSDTERNYHNAMAGKLPVSFETRMETKIADRNTWWEQNTYPGKDGVLSVYFRDIGERKQLEERMRHSQKLESLGILAGGIAHDFNNLLTAILGSASLAGEVLPANSPAAPYIANAVAAGERASQLTRQMLAYSGRGHFMVEPIDLSGQVRELAELLHASLGGNIQLVLNLEEGAWIEGDAGQFQSVIMNLVINGAEAMGERTGTVAVSTSIENLDAEFLRENFFGHELKPGPYVLLEVRDTGIGMSQETLARIYDPFFTTKFTGRGLGLAAVQGIVRGHKGVIKVSSIPGQGTSFQLFVPAVPGRIASDAAPRTSDLSGDATVLVVDDEEVVLKMAQATLKKHGYKVLTAANGLEAVNLFAGQPDRIGIVLLDMTMPVMSGEETLRELKKIRQNVRVVVSSGYNEAEALQRFGDGVAGFLQKPYRASVLAEKVKQHL